MQVKDFLGMNQRSDSLHWELAVNEHVVTPGNFLFGGCGLGAALVALEEAAERPTIWATAQYLSYAPLGSTLDIDVEILVVGGHVTQARAIGRDQDREVLSVTAALGSDRSELEGVWVTPPEVPAPNNCPPRRVPPMVENSIFHNVDTRVAYGRSWEELDGKPGSPNAAIWARIPGHLEPSAATLAIFGDYLTGGVADAVGRHTMGRSLDNTIRMVQAEETEWVLCDMRMHALVNGYAQGIAYLWSEQGTLLATASQSLAVKLWSLDG
jgi:acyl-CoA thioesterase